MSYYKLFLEHFTSTGLVLHIAGEIMTFHIAFALKAAAVTVGTVLWIGTAAAAALPLFQTGSAASSRPRGCLLREP